MSKDYKKVLKYLRDNISNYSESEINYICKNYDYLEHNKFVPDILRQIYDELGLLDDKDNLYLGFIDIIKDKFNIDSNIVEVGGGVIPSLGKNITLNQKSGTVTVYDPRLSIYEEDTSKFHLVRKPFTESTNIGNHNLMVALMPCEACETVIRSAIKNKIDFMLGFCEGGPHGDEFDYFEDDDEWLNSMLYLAKDGIEENGMGKMKVKYLQECKNPYPVIYNER